MARNRQRTRRMVAAAGVGLALTALLPAPTRADESHRSDRANEVHADQGPPPAADPSSEAPPPEAAPAAEPPAAEPPAAEPAGSPPAAAPAQGAQPAAAVEGPPAAAPAAPAAQDAQDAQDASPAPGNAGTVKIHRTETADADRRNEPHVCGFRIVGFGFPADAELEISIVGHGGPNAGTGSFAASVPSTSLSPEGDWAIAGPALPDGMYKLAVENTTAPGGAKQKVFKVDCSDASGTEESAPASGSVGSEQGGAGAGGVLGGATAAGGEAALTGTPSAPGAVGTLVLSGSASRVADVAAASAAPPVATEVAGSVLARTGTGVVGLALAGLALLLGGAALRRRTARLALGWHR